MPPSSCSSCARCGRAGRRWRLSWRRRCDARPGSKSGRSPPFWAGRAPRVPLPARLLPVRRPECAWLWLCSRGAPRGHGLPCAASGAAGGAWREGGTAQWRQIPGCSHPVHTLRTLFPRSPPARCRFAALRDVMRVTHFQVGGIALPSARTLRTNPASAGPPDLPGGILADCWHANGMPAWQGGRLWRQGRRRGTQKGERGRDWESCQAGECQHRRGAAAGSVQACSCCCPGLRSQLRCRPLPHSLVTMPAADAVHTGGPARACVCLRVGPHSRLTWLRQLGWLGDCARLDEPQARFARCARLPAGRQEAPPRAGCAAKQPAQSSCWLSSHFLSSRFFRASLLAWQAKSAAVPSWPILNFRALDYLPAIWVPFPQPRSHALKQNVGRWSAGPCLQQSEGYHSFHRYGASAA